MRQERHRAVPDAARNWNSVVFECDSLWELSYSSAHSGAMEGRDRSAGVLYYASLNETLGPHIRMGYIVVPPALVDPFAEMSQRMASGPDSFVLAALATFVESSDCAVDTRKMRAVYAQRLKLLVEAIQARVRDVTVVQPCSGLHVTILFNQPLGEQTLCSLACDRGMSLAPLSRFYCEAQRMQPPSGIVLGMGMVADRAIDRTVGRLEDVIREARELAAQ